MRPSAALPACSDDAPVVQSPRLRLTDDRRALPGVTYDSENYAMLNRPIETGRHFRRITRHLAPRSEQRLLEVGCGRGWLTQRVQQHCPATFGVDVNPRSIVHAVAPNLSVMDAVDLHYDDEQFDHVFSFHAIEHIAEGSRAVAVTAQEIASAAARQGALAAELAGSSWESAGVDDRGA